MAKQIKHILEENRDAIIASYKSGASLDDLSARFGCSNTPIRHFLTRNKIPFRAPVRPKILEKHFDEIEALYRQGEGVAEIGKHFGVNRDTVSLILKQRGIRRSVPLSKRSFQIEGEANKGLMAGLLMGEGSVVVRKDGGVSIRIVNQDEEILNWCAQWGGRLYWTPARNRCPKPCGIWDLSGAVNVLHFLIVITPYLVGARRARAENAMNILQSNYGLSADNGN